MMPIYARRMLGSHVGGPVMTAPTTPFRPPLSEAQAEMVMRNLDMGWDAGTIAEARALRDRQFRIGMVLPSDPLPRGQVVFAVVLGAAATLIGALAALWWWT